MPIHAGHVHVTDHQTKGFLLQSQQSRFGTLHRTVVMPAQREGIDQGLAQRAIIFDQQNPHRLSLRAALHAPYRANLTAT